MGRLLTLVVVWVLANAASAQAQSIVPIAGCDVFFTENRPIVDANKKLVRVELRRSEGLPVEVRCPDMQVFAREMDYWTEEERLDLRGQVVYQQGGTRIAAVSGSVDRKTRNAVFETASGSLQLTDRQVDRALFGSLEPEATFTATRIEKTGPRSYKLSGATFTTCVQPSRRWQISASRLSLTVDRYAVMTNARLEVKDVPVLYLPVFYYPIQEDDRATGFLMPGFGTSTLRGFSLSNAFFWAINRSHDATVYHDWYTGSGGHGLGLDYRYAGHTGSGDLRAHATDERAILDDNGQQLTEGRRNYEFRANLSQQLPGRIRLQGRANFVTDLTRQQLQHNDIGAITQSTRHLGLDAVGQWGRIRASAQATREDLLNSATTSTSFRTSPRINLSFADSPIGGSKIYVGGTIDALRASRVFETNGVETDQSITRGDALLTVRVPVSLGPALSLNGSVSARRTDWNAQLDPTTGLRVEDPLSRNLFEAQLQVTGPTFSRVFNTQGNRWVERVKHVITPTFSVMRRSTFEDFDRVIAFETAIDSLVGGTTQVTYGLRNQILARVRQEGAEPVVREILSLDLTQSYNTNALATQYQLSNAPVLGIDGSVLPPPSNFTPVSLALNVTPSPTMSGQFGLQFDTTFRAVRSYSASATVNQPTIEFTGAWTKQQVIRGLQGYEDPSNAPHSISVAGRVKKADGRAAISFATALDLLKERFIQHRLGLLLNAQCCGIVVDYVVVNWSHYGRRNDKRLSFSINLAGIGSFANPMGMFGNNGRE